MIEIWKLIPGSPGYFVSDWGRVKHIWPSGIVKFLRPAVRGVYLTVVLTGQKTVRVHRIVALAFHGSPKSDQPIVRHLDGFSWNNRADNVRWGTYKENMADAMLHRRQRNGSNWPLSLPA
jgi:hypothetical protein